MSVFCLDIDGVICKTNNGDYVYSKPDYGVIDKVNTLWDAGHKIIFYTSRGQTSGLDWTELTEKQLLDWGVKYDGLFMNKPEADFYIDDRSINIKDWRING